MSGLGSGTMLRGRNSAPVNDTSLLSGSFAAATFVQNPGNASGTVYIKYLKYTAGSPANSAAFDVISNFPVENDTKFVYVIANAGG